MMYDYVHGRIKSSSGILLGMFLLFNAPFLIAQNHSPDFFPDMDSWGDSPEQVAASKGFPHNPLESKGFTVYTYPIVHFDSQGEVSYYFDEKGLTSVQYVFQAPTKAQKNALFSRLESALTSLFKTPGIRLDANKNGVELMQALWENDSTLTYLSSFSSLSEITLKFLDKTVQSNQVEIELMRKIRPYKAGLKNE